MISLNAIGYISILQTTIKTHFNPPPVISMDIVEQYTRIITCMFEDGIVNRGRIVVLEIFTDNLCESAPREIPVKIREQYFKFIRENGIGKD